MVEFDGPDKQSCCSYLCMLVPPCLSCLGNLAKGILNNSGDPAIFILLVSQWYSWSPIACLGHRVLEWGYIHPIVCTPSIQYRWASANRVNWPTGTACNRPYIAQSVPSGGNDPMEHTAPVSQSVPNITIGAKWHHWCARANSPIGTNGPLSSLSNDKY
jgi:hypothetical protein